MKLLLTGAWMIKHFIVDANGFVFKPFQIFSLYVH